MARCQRQQRPHQQCRKPGCKACRALLPDARRSLGAGPDAVGSPRIQALQLSAVLRSNHATQCADAWPLCKGSTLKHECTRRWYVLPAACRWGHPACLLLSFAVQDCQQPVFAG